MLWLESCKVDSHLASIYLLQGALGCPGAFPCPQKGEGALGCSGAFPCPQKGEGAPFLEKIRSFRLDMKLHFFFELIFVSTLLRSMVLNDLRINSFLRN